MDRNDDRVWFTIGDIIKVSLWDNDEERNLKGLVEITGWSDHNDTIYGIYYIRCIQGNIDWTAIEVTYLQENVIKYIGTIENNKTLKVLYGNK